MKKIAIKIGNKTREVEAPETWDDLDLRSFLLFYSTLFVTIGDDYTASSFTAVKLISMVQHVLRVGPDFMAKWEADCLRLDPQNGDLTFLDELKQVIGHTLGGLFDIETTEEGATPYAVRTTYAVRFNRTVNPYPSLAHTDKPTGKGKSLKPGKTTWYYAPKDGLANITLYELAYTFTLYENYVKTRDEQFAQLLIAALYRPSRPETRNDRETDWGGDRRQALRNAEGMVDKRAEQVKGLPTLTQRVIVFWFAGCREAIISRYPKVFKRSDDKKAGGPVRNYGWGEVLLSIADGPANLGVVSDQHYSNALAWLSMKEDERIDQERAVERMRRKS